jgi:membrane-associated phospholipid phosphatase
MFLNRRAAMVGKILFAVALIALAHALDPWAIQTLASRNFGDSDLGRLLRSIGYLPVWLLAGLALALAGSTQDRVRRGALLAGAAFSGGLIAEIAKGITGRLRPESVFEGYRFRDIADVPLTDLTVNVGLPSSHSLVAFAAAFMLSRLFPEARWIWLALAAGCAYSRVAVGAHYLSDVTVAAVIAYVLVAVLWRRYAQPNACTVGAQSSGR